MAVTLRTVSDIADCEEATVTRQLQVRLSGGDATLGQIPSMHVAHLLEGVEIAIQRAAAVVVGRQPGVGRRGRVVEEATRLRFVNIRQGSVIPVLALPEIDTSPGALTLDDRSLGEIALEVSLAVLDEIDAVPEVAAAWADLGERLQLGTRYDALEFRSRQRQPFGHRLDGARCRRMREAAKVHSGDAILSGILVEADFDKMTAQLRIPNRRKVRIKFSEEHADAIHDALRHESDVQGEVSYIRDEAQKVDLVSINRSFQPSIFGNEFWTERSVAELAAEQAVQIVSSAEEAFDDLGLSDDEADAFLDATMA